ncbi:MAG: poly(3-hydroxyalkanoate) depolymerase [Rhizobiaceae bacterium]
MATKAKAKPIHSSTMQIRMIDVGGQKLCVGIRRGLADRPPLLLFNGIGANLELGRSFIEALDDTTAIIFDIPGVGGSPAPAFPYRPSTLARLARNLVRELGFDKVDVSGVSWGGGLAQQFAFQYPDVCRKLVLAATSAGAIMIPGKPAVLSKMGSPRRYTDRNYLQSIAPDIYGGTFRRDAGLIIRHASAMKGATRYGYLLQLLAMVGWTSLPWLWLLRQPTLIMAGSDDPLVPVANARLLNTMIPNSRLEILDDGHLFLVTRPRECAEMIEAFLRE